LFSPALNRHPLLATRGEDVEVKFGASIGGLTAGINQVKEEIEGLRAPVDSFIGSLSDVAEAIGATFGGRQDRRIPEKFGETGKHAENMAATIGVSAEPVASDQASGPT
jgi:hypothetical protein